MPSSDLVSSSGGLGNEIGRVPLRHHRHHEQLSMPAPRRDFLPMLTHHPATNAGSHRLLRHRQIGGTSLYEPTNSASSVGKTAHPSPRREFELFCVSIYASAPTDRRLSAVLAFCKPQEILRGIRTEAASTLASPDLAGYSSCLPWSCRIRFVVCWWTAPPPPPPASDALWRRWCSAPPHVHPRRARRCSSLVSSVFSTEPSAWDHLMNLGRRLAVLP